MRNDEAHRDDITIEEEAMEQYVRPGLDIGHLIPDIKLTALDGQIISPVDYKEKKNLVIIFFNPLDHDDIEILAEVKKRYHEIADVNAEVLGIATGAIEEFVECAKTLDLPYHILSDMKGEAKCAYCVTGSMIFVADKFGELKMISDLSKDVVSALDEAISKLELIEMECPECGVSTWPIE